MDKRGVQEVSYTRVSKDRESIDASTRHREAEEGQEIRRSPPVRLVSHGLPHGTIEAFEAVLSDARKGNVAGALICIMYSNKDIDIANTDEFFRNPYIGRAMVAELNDYLGEQTAAMRQALIKGKWRSE